MGHNPQLDAHLVRQVARDKRSERSFRQKLNCGKLANVYQRARLSTNLRNGTVLFSEKPLLVTPNRNSFCCSSGIAWLCQRAMLFVLRQQKKPTQSREIKLRSYSSERENIDAIWARDLLDISDFDVMTIKVAAATQDAVTRLPDSLATIARLDESQANMTRTFKLQMVAFRINGKSMDINRIDETIKLDDVEIWEITNNSEHQRIEDGQTWRANFTILNEPATYWYHPHLEGDTSRWWFRVIIGLTICTGQGRRTRTHHHRRHNRQKSVHE